MTVSGKQMVTTGVLGRQHNGRSRGNMIEAFPLLEGRPYGVPVVVDLGPSDDAHVFEMALSEAEDAVDAGSAPDIAAIPLS